MQGTLLGRSAISTTLGFLSRDKECKHSADRDGRDGRDDAAYSVAGSVMNSCTLFCNEVPSHP